MIFHRATLETWTLTALRIVTGCMLALHGAQKLFGVLTTRAPVELLSQKVSCSVINAGDGTHQHPTQALLDALTERIPEPDVRTDRRAGSTSAPDRLTSAGQGDDHDGQEHAVERS